MAFIDPNLFVEQIKKGKSPNIKTDSTIVTDDKEPSVVGGLAALGATIVGATALGKRIPAIRNYFKSTPKKTLQFKPNKTTATGDMPTATGQASELITAPSKALVPVAVNKSKYAQVRDIPFTQGQGYKKQNPIVGSAAYDWAMEAPFERAPAKQWIKWFNRGNSDHPVPTGPLQGVSRRVIPEELDEINLISADGKGGFLKFAEDRNMIVDRDTILTMINRAPINNVNVFRFRTRGAPESEFTELGDELRKLASTVQGDDAGRVRDAADRAAGTLTKMSETAFRSRDVLSRDSIQDVQKQILEMGKNIPQANQGPFREIYKKFNQKVYNYDKLGAKVPDEFTRKTIDNEAPNAFTGSSKNYFPKYKDTTGRGYIMSAGENYTEDVIYYKGRVPNTKSGQFSYANGPHYLNNEIAFVRYDDLPNPKLGQNARHVRVSELQTDIHSAQFDKNQKAEYFKKKINPFNTNIQADILKKERNVLLEKLAPYRELGRGALTRSQEQEVAKLTYQLNQLNKSAVSQLSTASNIYSTTAAPLARSNADFVIKNILRDMAERRINAISIVPSAMNKGVKMPNPGQIGDELNYGLMNGRAMRKTPDGKIKESSELATNVKVLKKIAKQYNAKFEQFDMPKSNPNKEFKIIRTYKSSDNQEFGRMAKDGRAAYDRKIGDVFEYDDHIAAARTEREADDLLEAILRSAGNDIDAKRSSYKIVRMIPTNPDNYIKVPTLIADNQVLDKFLLPMKAYMKTGGLVDNTNIFKSLI